MQSVLIVLRDTKSPPYARNANSTRLMRSATWIEGAGFRPETITGFLTQLKNRRFNPRFFDFFFQLAVGKAEIFNPTRQSDSCIGKVRKSLPHTVRVSHTHATTTRHTTRRHTTSTTPTSLLSLLLLCSPRVSIIHPYLRPSAARVSTRWP